MLAFCTMTTFPKLWKREFPLIEYQIWGRCYKKFLGEEIKLFPRYVFVLKNGLGEIYRNPALSEAVNTIIKSKAEYNQKYFDDFCVEHLDLLKQLKNLWERNNLTLKELKHFLDLLYKFWPAIYASIFIPSDESFDEEHQKLFMSLRERIESVEHKAHHLINLTLQKLHPELTEFVWAVSYDDLTKNGIPDKKTLEKRVSNKIIVIDDKIVDETKFEDLKKEYNFTLEAPIDTHTIKEFKGQGAYMGKIKGVVRIIMKEADINKVQESEILVCPMTLPTFAIAMKKAAAFVTDEGGITCHAAIAAREMKKPCIIGTKIATQVLKDGDLIEVDANNGIVKILDKVKDKQ